VRALAAATVLLAAALALPATAHAGSSLQVVTVPKVPGARFVVDGQTFVADGTGIAYLPASAVGSTQKPEALDVRLKSGVRAQFARWYGSAASGRLRATYNIYYRIRPTFFDLHRTNVADDLVSSATVRSSIGVRYTIKPGRSQWLQGGRVVPLNGSLEPKEIYYTFERVVVAGANVVNNGQQKFFPSELAASSRSADALIPVELLFYQARFRARDAFFGFAIGDRIRLRWPNGRVEKYPIGDAGNVSIPALPRGEYRVAVEGPGLSLSGPVTLSKNQDIEVALLSYIDIGVVAAVALAFGLGLPLTTRRHLLARVRPRRLASLDRLRRPKQGKSRNEAEPAEDAHGRELVVTADDGPGQAAEPRDSGRPRSDGHPNAAKPDKVGGLAGLRPAAAQPTLDDQANNGTSTPADEALAELLREFGEKT
jgi:hypothetical protein